MFFESESESESRNFPNPNLFESGFETFLGSKPVKKTQKFRIRTQSFESGFGSYRALGGTLTNKLIGRTYRHFKNDFLKSTKKKTPKVNEPVKRAGRKSPFEESDAALIKLVADDFGRS